jgi:chaperonin GroEL
VGGATNVELKEKKQRVENALNATQAVVEEGVVPGGGVALLNAACALEAFVCQSSEEATATAIIRRALEEPMRTLVSNAGMESAVILANVRRRQQLEHNNRVGYNVMSEQYEDMIVTGIIDPAKVTRSAVQSAASIASMILTTDALVADVPNRQTAISALKT